MPGSGTCRPLGGTGGRGSRHILTTSRTIPSLAPLLLEERAELVWVCGDQSAGCREAGLSESGFPAWVELAEPLAGCALADPLALPHAQPPGGVLSAPPVRLLRALALVDLAVGRKAAVRALIESVRRLLLTAVGADLPCLSNDGERVATITLHLGCLPRVSGLPGRLRLERSKPLRRPLTEWLEGAPGGARMTADLPAGRGVRRRNRAGRQGTSYARDTQLRRDVGGPSETLRNGRQPVEGLVSARTWGFKSPLRHQPLAYQVGGDDHEPLGGLVDPLDAELVIQRRAPGAVSVVKRCQKAAGLGDNAAQRGPVQPGGGGGAQAGALGLGGRLGGGGLVDPGGHLDGVGAGRQCGAVLGELALAVGDGLLGRIELLSGGGVVVAGLLQGVQGVVEPVGVEQAGEPLVQVGQQVGLAQVDRARVV